MNEQQVKLPHIQEIIQRYALGAVYTIERTLETTHGLEISGNLFQLRQATLNLVAQMQQEALPISMLNAISAELLNTIQLCVQAAVLGRGQTETIQ